MNGAGFDLVQQLKLPTCLRSMPHRSEAADVRTGGMADTAYEYTLSGPEEKMTGTFVAKAAICGQAAGRGVCAGARKQAFSSTWTRIEDCDK